MKPTKSIISGLFVSSIAIMMLSIMSSFGQAQPTSAVNTAANNQAEERIPFGADGSLFLAGNDCGPNEVLATGSLPTCEPTCENPRPMCPKIFFSGLDYVPCFCKSPLVRNVKTKQCIQLADCPK